MRASLLERFRALAATSEGGAGRSALVQPAKPESDFLARVAPVTRLLKEAGDVLERGKRSKTSHVWDEEGAAVVELKLVEEALGEAGSCLGLVRKGLWKEGVASEQHREHYEAIVRALERRKVVLGVAVFQQKTQRLAELAASNSVARAKLIELRNDDDGIGATPLTGAALYGEDDVAAAVPRYELTAEEQQELERENADLQMRMMDSVVDAAQDIQRQLSELSAMMTQFSLEISVQNEGEQIWRVLCCL